MLCVFYLTEYSRRVSKWSIFIYIKNCKSCLDILVFVKCVLSAYLLND